MLQAERPLRVVSLLAGATEVVARLGMLHALVGRSHECDFPRAVEMLPQLSAPLIDPDATSEEIDRAVRAQTDSGHSVYRVDAKALASLRPDVILTQTHCAVCAVSPRDIVDYLKALPEDHPVSVVSFSPHSLADLSPAVIGIADALGVAERGRALVQEMELRLKLLGSAVSGRARPRVFFVEWIEPLMGAGNWMPELVEAAGGRLVGGHEGEKSPWITHDELAALDPDVIVAAPCGFGVERTRVEIKALDGSRTWRSLRAVREGRTFIADGTSYFNRAGPRLIDSAEILAEILHPDQVSFGRGGWALA